MESPSEARPPQPARSIAGRRTASAVASLFVGPGTGHLSIRRFGRGAIWYALTWVSLVSYMFVGVWALLPLLPIYIGAIIDVCVIAPRRFPLPGWGRVVGLWIAMLVFGMLLNTGFRAHVETFKMPAGSMIPTLEPGDNFVVKKLAYSPSRGDIIVFRYPQDERKDFVKRIIALGGDTVAFQGKAVFLNGRPLKRTKIPERCTYRDEDDTGNATMRPCIAFEEDLAGKTYRIVQDPDAPTTSPDREPQKVPDGHVYVMGDNRDNSFDSRFMGPIPLDKIKGKADFIAWSVGEGGLRWDRFGKRLE